MKTESFNFANTCITDFYFNIDCIIVNFDFKNP